MRNSILKSTARMIITLGTSFLAAKAAGWVFDSVVGRRS